MASVLIIDDEVPICKTLALHLRRDEHQVEWVNTAEEGLVRLDGGDVDIVILDVRLPGMDGLTALQHIRDKGHQINVIMITAFHDLEIPAKAMLYGAIEFIHKPIDIDELDRVMEKLAAHACEAEDDKVLRLEPDMEGAAVVGRSRLMQEIFKLIGKVSQTRSTVLIEGESGTGKELIARAIHDNTPKTTGSFVAINCAAIVDNLLESELFGHEKGAFTDAVARKDGKFTLAGGGTLFLDEIGDMPANLQAKLLRVLQERCFERVGGKDMLPFKARLITATNRHLEEEVKKGNFREDLYYRLNVVRIHVPPLRERREDIPVLVAHLLNKISKDVGKLVTRIPASVMADLVAYDWPGNVREMENMLMRAVVMTDSDILHVDLPGGKEGLATSASFPDAVVESAIFRSLAEVESEHIDRTLRATGWHKGQACDVLGISRPRLERKIRLYKLTRT